MEKSFKKTLLASLALLMAGLLALTTVTYAWFTTGDKATVGTFQLNVEAAEGLLISTAPDSDFKSSIAASEIYAANPDTTVTATDTPIVLKPVSTVAAAPAGVMTFYKATPAPDNASMITAAKVVKGDKASAEAAGGYMSFNLYIYNSSASDKTVYLCGPKDGDAKTTVTMTESTSKPSHYAARIAFVEGKSAVYGTGTIDMESESNPVQIYEPNATSHTNAGVALQKALTAATGTPSGKFSYKGLNAAVEGTAKKMNDVGAAVTTKDETRGATGVSLVVPSGKVLRTIVYFWIEGQDVDCLNDVSGGNMDINLVLDASVAAE